MQLGADTSVTTTDLIGLTRFYSNTDDVTFTADEIKGLLNTAQRELQAIILDSMDSWDFNGQEATADLVLDQREYAWPSDLLQIKRMDLQLDGVNFRRAKAWDTATHESPIATELDIRQRMGRLTLAQPRYDAFDDNFKIYSSQAIIDVTGGIFIQYQEQIVDLALLTDIPVFVEFSQTWLARFAASEFFSRFEQPTKGEQAEIKMQRLEEKIRNYYAQRNEDKSRRPRLGKRRNSWFYH